MTCYLAYNLPYNPVYCSNIQHNVGSHIGAMECDLVKPHHNTSTTPSPY